MMRERRQGRMGGLRKVAWLGALLGVLALMQTSVLYAQDRYAELAERYSRPRLYHEAFALPGEPQPALVVSFRIPNAMLVFVQAPSGASGGAFVAEAEVTVQVYRGASLLDEQVWQRTHYTSDFDATQSREADVEGLAGFALEPGMYAYRLVIGDDHSERRRELELRTVEVPDFAGGDVGEPVMARDVQADGADGADVRLRLVGLGGDVPFGRPAEAVVPLSLPPDVHPEAARLTYALHERNEADVYREEAHAQAAPVRRTRDGVVLPPVYVVRKGRIVATGEVGGEAFRPVLPLEPAEQEGGRLSWTSASSSPAGYLARIPLGSERLPDGAYVIEMALHTGEETGEPVAQRQTTFRTRWPDKPLSLYNPDVAIRNLQLIEDRTTIRAMLKGTRQEQQSRLDAYWDKRDPTPETPVNELMNEYYRRIDYAADAFRTGLVATPDGLRTDRARVYIVHGPPQRVERSFPSPGGVEETWTYADGRQFVFHAATSLGAFDLERSSVP